MKPVIESVKKYLQVRTGNFVENKRFYFNFSFYLTGEVDCNFRPTSDLLVTRSDIDKHLDEKVGRIYLSFFF
jgi:hypothetical protein